MDNNKAVKTDAQTAAPEGEVKETSVEQIPDDNYESRLSVIEEELEKTRKERDSYKIGLLKAKGKLTDEQLADEEERLRQIVREEFLAGRQSNLEREKDDLLKKALKENAELKTTIKSKAGVQTKASSGGSQDKPEVKTGSFLSEEQKTHLMNKPGIKWTPEMVAKLEEKLRSK